MNTDFIPPRRSAALIAFIDAIYRIGIKIREHVQEIVVPPEDWERLVALKNRPALILCNHPSITEPTIVYGISRRLREEWYYMSSLELFAGWAGWVLNNLNAFSVRRGSADRESLKMAQKVLTTRGGKLVILPEAEPYGRNDRLIPFNPGALQIAFWAMGRPRREEDDKEDETAKAATSQSFPIVPMVIRYQYVGDPRPILKAGFDNYDRAIGEESAQNRNLPLEERARRGGQTMLARLEQEYALMPGVSLDDDTRIRRLFGQIETRICATLNIATPTTSNAVERQRALYNAIWEFRDTFKETCDKNIYDKKRDERRQAMAVCLTADVRVYENLATLDSDTMQNFPTLERIGEMLTRMEKEVWRGFNSDGKTFPMRAAHVRVAPGIEMAEWSARYKENRRRTVAALTQHVEETMAAMLRETDALATPTGAETRPAPM